MMNRWYLLLIVLGVGLGMAGCASPGSSSTEPLANTGYVDLCPDPAGEFSWEVEKFDAGSGKYKRIYSKTEPQPGPLRLAFAPGQHRLRITFLNKATLGPAETQVDVQDGKVTPVQITFTEEGSSLVEKKSLYRGGTARGVYGQRTKFSNETTVTYELSASAGPAVPYKPLDR